MTGTTQPKFRNHCRITIIDIDQEFQQIYDELLGLKYQLEFVTSVKDLVASVETDPPHLILGDLRLPGQSLLHFFRTSESQLVAEIPFLVVSAIEDIDIIRECYGLGVRDYLIKPFHKVELVVKIEQIINGQNKRWAPRPKETSDLGIKVDLNLQIATYRGRESAMLTSKEIRILNCIANSPNTTADRDVILKEVWGKTRVHPKTLDVHLSNMRPKVREIGLDLVFLAHNGYCLKPVKANLPASRESDNRSSADPVH